MRDLVRDEETGIRLTRGNADEISERVLPLAVDPEHLRAMGEAGQRRISPRRSEASSRAVKTSSN